MLHVQRPAGTDRQAGFTLLEILVTLAILGLVMTALYGTLISTLETRDVIETRTRGPREGLALLEILSTDFRSAILPPLAKKHFVARAERSGEGRDADQVTFISAVTSRFAEDPRRLRGEELAGVDPTERDEDVEPVRADLCEIGYYLKPDERHPGRMKLYRREDFHVDHDPRKGGTYLLLYRRVAGLKLRWFRGDETETGSEPQENWDAEKTGTVPTAVLIELTLDLTPDTDDDERSVGGEPVLKTFKTIVPMPAGRKPKEQDQANAAPTGPAGG